MKKLIAILLSIICVFSAFSIGAVAAGDINDLIGDSMGLPSEDDEAAAIEYGIYFECATISTETIVYMPSHTLTLRAPAEVILTSDTPIAVDHNWVCWKDKESGKLYYPGDKIIVEGKVTLIAVWEEKQDNFGPFRGFIAGLQALVRMIEKFLGVFDAINATKPLEPAA